MFRFEEVSLFLGSFFLIQIKEECVKRNLNDNELCEDWVIAIATKKAKEFKKQWSCFKNDEVEDLVHECIKHWVKNRRKYNPNAGANQRTFMARIFTNKLMDLVRKQNADKRKSLFKSESLDAPDSDKPNSSTKLDKLIQPDHFGMRAKLDVLFVTEKLPPIQKQICKLMKDEGLSGRAIGVRLGKHHSTINEHIVCIRKFFETENLRKYLK